jgi:hypothetical protein
VSELLSKLEAVRDRESFLDFVQALIEDRLEKAKNERSYPYGGQHDGWDNSKIEDYLEAALAWGRDSRGLPNGLPAEPSWHGFATFLYCGKIYE